MRGSGRPWALLEPATQLGATRPHAVLASWLLATPPEASERDGTAAGSLRSCAQCPPDLGHRRGGGSRAPYTPLRSCLRDPWASLSSPVSANEGRPPPKASWVPAAFLGAAAGWGRRCPESVQLNRCATGHPRLQANRPEEEASHGLSQKRTDLASKCGLLHPEPCSPFPVPGEIRAPGCPRAPLGRSPLWPVACTFDTSQRTRP